MCAIARCFINLNKVNFSEAVFVLAADNVLLNFLKKILCMFLDYFDKLM